MAIPTDYPIDKLPAPLVGKQRTLKQTYDTRGTFDGYDIPRSISSNSPVYFDVSFKVRSNDRMVFLIWLEQVSDGKNFIMPLVTEGGTFDHTGFFTELPQNPIESRGDVYTFTGTFFARALNNGLNTATDEQKDLMFNLGNDAIIIERVVNEVWPT